MKITTVVVIVHMIITTVVVIVHMIVIVIVLLMVMTAARAKRGTDCGPRPR